MVRARPFNFDFSFDDGADEARAAAEAAARRAEEEAEANRPPTFSVEELEAAKAEAHAAGRQEGMADAMAGIEQQVARTMDAVFSRLPKVFEEYAAWSKTLEADALRLSMTLMRKLAPELSQYRQLAEVEQVVQEAFGYLTEQPKVMIRVASELEEPLKDKVGLMASRVGYEGQVVLVGDPELAADDCRISWQAGAVERSLDDIWSQVDDIVSRALGDQPPRPAAGREDAGREDAPAAADAVVDAGKTPVPPPAGDADPQAEHHLEEAVDGPR